MVLKLSSLVSAHSLEDLSLQNSNVELLLNRALKINNIFWNTTYWSCQLFWIILYGQEILSSKLKVQYSWSSVEFLYSDLEQRGQDISSGAFNPFNVIILDADYFQGTYFVTTPPLLGGSPSTLNTISTSLDSNGAYLLKPFPDWAWQNRKSCDGLISVFRIAIDKLGRLWAIDSGYVNAFTENAKIICPPKIVAFDLKNNNSLITKYVFSQEETTSDSVVLNIQVQILNECDDTFVYLADAGLGRMLVYQLAKNTSHMLEHPYFQSVPEYFIFNINGVTFNNTDNLFSLALDFKKDLMYFHALASGSECYVSANILRKNTGLTEHDKQEFKQFPCKKKFHTSSKVVTPDGYLIFSNLENNALYFWNSKTSFQPRNFRLIEKNRVTLQFPSGMKLINNKLLVTTCRLQNVIAKKQNDRGKVNFRILEGQLPFILQGSGDDRI